MNMDTTLLGIIVMGLSLPYLSLAVDGVNMPYWHLTMNRFVPMEGGILFITGLYLLLTGLEEKKEVKQ